MLALDTPVSKISPIGARVSPHIRKLGIITARQLIEYFPYRWDDLSAISTIASLSPQPLATIRAHIETIENRRSWKKRILVTHAIVADPTGSIPVIWFNQAFLTKTLHPGDEVFLSGKISLEQSGLAFINPNYERISDVSRTQGTHHGRIVPRYELTARVTQKQLRYLIKLVLPLARSLPDWLPDNIIKHYQLAPLSRAFEHIHFPPSQELLARARERLKFDELLLLQLSNIRAKCSFAAHKSIPIPFDEFQTRALVSRLPFALTPAQKKAAWRIIKDLSRPVPMNRLLQGDVGSGKTIVAMIAALNTARAGRQTAYMAPTEILAQQIFEHATAILAPLGVSTALLTRTKRLASLATAPPGQPPIETTRTKLLSLLSCGTIQIIFGTHSLINSSVNFSSLAFIIIDEQHRFGVRQRAALLHKADERHSKKNSSGQKDTAVPHFLSLSATPIPRSLALTVYGDLDLSVIDTMPPGRIPVKTRVILPHERTMAYQTIAAEIEKGRQVFAICPLIDPSDTLGVKSVQELFQLFCSLFPSARISTLHGKLSEQAKERIMRQFRDLHLDILIATTVVEVGIDIPNATVIVIESAERFGLAQLHQLRGRVGRSGHPSHCFLFTETETASALKRLSILTRSSNGFEIAEADLEFRGPGEALGVSQSGFVDRLKIARLTDYPLIALTREVVAHLLESDPTLARFPLVLKKITAWEREIHRE